jgi:hypothetical protein
MYQCLISALSKTESTEPSEMVWHALKDAMVLLNSGRDPERAWLNGPRTAWIEYRRTANPADGREAGRPQAYADDLKRAGEVVETFKAIHGISGQRAKRDWEILERRANAESWRSIAARVGLVQSGVRDRHRAACMKLVDELRRMGFFGGGVQSLRSIDRFKKRRSRSRLSAIDARTLA